LHSVTNPDDEQSSTKQNFFQKFRGKKENKKPAEVVSLASLVRYNYSLFNKNYDIYTLVSICHNTRYNLYITWYCRWFGSWCSFTINGSYIWRSFKYIYWSNYWFVYT
jgi:hypothetical protein